MMRRIDHIKRGLLMAFETDPQVKQDEFTGTFSKEAFIGFVFDNLIMLSMKQATSCDFLLELIGKAIC